MKDILKKLTDLLSDCEHRLSELIQKIHDAEAEKLSAEKVKQDYEAKIADLEGREQALKESEFINQTLHDAHMAMQEADNAKMNLNKLKDELDTNVRNFQKEKTQFKADVARREFDFAEQDRELEEKKKNYKIQVLEAVAKENKIKVKA